MSRSSTLPPPLTSSAREARFSFYCTLCSKGYQRIHEFEAHENSYDHQHKKRFQEMKALQKPVSRTRRDSGESGMGGIKPISLAGEGGGKPKKRGGFKSAFGGEEKKAEVKEEVKVGEVETDDEDDEGGYDPARPTGL